MGGFYGVSMAQQRRSRRLPAVLPPLAGNGRNLVINTSVLDREPTGRLHGVCRRRIWFPELKSVCSRHFGLAVRLTTPSLLDFDPVRVYESTAVYPCTSLNQALLQGSSPPPVGSHPSLPPSLAPPTYTPGQAHYSREHAVMPDHGHSEDQSQSLIMTPVDTEVVSTQTATGGL